MYLTIDFSCVAETSWVGNLHKYIEVFIHFFIPFIKVYVIGVRQAMAVRCGNVSILFPYVTYFLITCIIQGYSSVLDNRLKGDQNI
jgi:hypothetical protein